MELDNEQVIRHSTIGYKSDSKPYSFLADTKSFENKEKPLDSTGLSTDGFLKEYQNGIVCDTKDDDQDSDLSKYLDNARDESTTLMKLDCSNRLHDFANGNEKEVRDFVTLNSHSSKNMDCFQDSVFYLDKTVMECQLPELVVCYKESTYHFVKDICIDEGVPAQDKFLFDTDGDEKSDCYFLQSEKDRDSKLMKDRSAMDMPMQDVPSFSEENQSGEDIDNELVSNRKQVTDTCMQDVPLSLEENESNNGISKQCDSEDLTMTTEAKDDAMKMTADDVSKELFTLGDILSLPELTRVKSEAMSTNCGTDGIEQQSFENRNKNEVIVVSAVEESNNPSEEAIRSTPALVSAAEGTDSGKGEAMPISPARASASEDSTSSSLVKEVSNDNKLETISITSDSGSSAPTPTKADREPPETGRAPKDTADQPFSSYLQHGNGESSFSAAGPVTGLISYSGPISYSGNLSHRSDSSTTSTRSFAFPILQSEWNRSPVRMAKADRRQYRKHRGWRHSFLCCKF